MVITISSGCTLLSELYRRDLIFPTRLAIALNTNTKSDDYWIGLDSLPQSPAGPYLSVETIKDLKPLDAQFGVAAPKTLPDALYDALFGPQDPTVAELAQAGGDPAKVGPLHAYAILDTAKVTGLPELLTASGLEHRCLFKGVAFDALQNVAPWIVRLEVGNNFVRNLFTHSDVIWHLWNKEPGIYLRSRGTLDEMWRHFRKFTKQQDAEGKW